MYCRINWSISCFILIFRNLLLYLNYWFILTRLAFLLRLKTVENITTKFFTELWTLTDQYQWDSHSDSLLLWLNVNKDAPLPPAVDQYTQVNVTSFVIITRHLDLNNMFTGALKKTKP